MQMEPNLISNQTCFTTRSFRNPKNQSQGWTRGSIQNRKREFQPRSRT